MLSENNLPLFEEQNQKSITILQNQLTKKGEEVTRLENEVRRVEVERDARPTITLAQWNNDYSKRPTMQEFEKIQKLHDTIVRGAIDKIGDDWKRVLKIEEYYNRIEQSSK